jgi:hypothetical protein
MISDFGITIREICATCKFKMIGRETHKCKLNGKSVRIDHSCGHYEVIPCLMKAGKGNGEVKPKSVLMENLERLCSIGSKYVVKEKTLKVKELQSRKRKGK